MTDVLGNFVPRPMGAERHELHIPHSPESVWAALTTLSPAELPMVRALMSVRSLPAKGFTAEAPTMIGTMLSRGWFELATEPHRHVVLGSISQFWRLRPGDWRRKCPPEQFLDYDAPDFAKSASVFELIPTTTGTLLRTETRVTAENPATQRKMLAYWRLIRPFSGLIRQVMLRAVAKKAAALA